MSHSRWTIPAVLLTLLLAPIPAARAAEPPGAPLNFERDVRPILKTHCFRCHGEQTKIRGDLDLRLVRSMVAGGISGEAIVPGHHDDSYLWMRLEADEMPPGDKKLSSVEKAAIASWIDQGASTIRPEPETLPPGMVLTEEEKSFWAFQPVRRSDLPEVEDRTLVRTPIDTFLLAKLETQSLSFSPEADRRTLIRRATFDLTGLPPTPTEVAAFLNDDSPEAYEHLIDRLLESPHYGERWGRHWLDVAGYADSDGYTARDNVRKYAYKYRDYLVRSLNADRPWDELIREQLAGDEMLAPPYKNLSATDTDRLIATGFLRMAPDGSGDPDAEPTAARNDTVAETIKIVSTSLLGLTVGCAQCHAHRYDPISHEDYYRFRALFEPAYDVEHWRHPSARLVSLWTDAEWKKAAEVDAEVAAINKERSAALEKLVQEVLERELAVAPEELRPRLCEARDTPAGKRSDEQKQLLKTYPRVLVTTGNVSLYDAKAHRDIISEFSKKTAAVKAKRPPDNYVRALTEVPGQVPVTHLFDRGDFNQPRQAVEPAELTVLTATTGTPEIPTNDPDLTTTGRRLAYARHLTSGAHPLVARVLMNRVWMHHFGRGIVATPGDFGRLGERPSHPELLDWLADDFMRGGWTLKRIHRQIMLSAAYRQSSRRTAALDAVDPDNRLLGRMSVRRLEAEAVRDAVLAVSGLLNPKMSGPPVPVAPDEVGQIIVGADNRDSAGRPVGKRASIGREPFRRSLYIQVRRTMPLSVLEAFDAPVMSPNCERRSASTVAPQALMLMNNEDIIAASEAFADRLASEVGEDAADQVELAWRLAFCVEPSPDQVASALTFLERQRTDFAAAHVEVKNDSPAPDPDRQALASFAQALLSSNAFLYVD